MLAKSTVAPPAAMGDSAAQAGRRTAARRGKWRAAGSRVHQRSRSTRSCISGGLAMLAMHERGQEVIEVLQGAGSSRCRSSGLAGCDLVHVHRLLLDGRRRTTAWPACARAGVRGRVRRRRRHRRRAARAGSGSSRPGRSRAPGATSSACSRASGQVDLVTTPSDDLADRFEAAGAAPRRGDRQLPARGVRPRPAAGARRRRGRVARGLRACARRRGARPAGGPASRCSTRTRRPAS